MKAADIFQIALVFISLITGFVSSWFFFRIRTRADVIELSSKPISHSVSSPERSILMKIRSSPGCTVYDLAPFAPRDHMVTDYPAGYYLKKHLLRLMEWNLIEAYENKKLVGAVEFGTDYCSFAYHNYKFYLSPTAIAMQETLGLSLTGLPDSIFGPPIKPKSWPQVFVLMPFAPNLEPVFDDHIKKVADEMYLTCARADDFFSTGSIIQEIWSAIFYAQSIVADCTGRNPNVFYEIGMAHTLGKKTILLAQTIDDVPFDIQSYRVIIYEYTPRGMRLFEETLKSTLMSS